MLLEWLTFIIFIISSFIPSMASLRESYSYKFIGEVERGTVSPSVDSLIGIAIALDVDLKDLLPDEHDLFNGFSHEDLKTIKKAVKLLNSRLK